MTWRLMENHHLHPHNPEYDEDKYPVNLKDPPLQLLDTINLEFGHELTDEQKTREQTDAENKQKRPHPIPCLLFERNPSHFLWNIVLPLFLIVLGCLLDLLLNVFKFNKVCFTSMLTGLLRVASYKSSIQKKDLPTTTS